MNLTEKLQAVIRFGQFSPVMDRMEPVRLYFYQYDNSREDKDDTLNGKWVFDLSIPGPSGTSSFHAETLEACADKALAYLLKRRREYAEDARKRATAEGKIADDWEKSVREFEATLAGSR